MPSRSPSPAVGNKADEIEMDEQISRQQQRKRNQHRRLRQFLPAKISRATTIRELNSPEQHETCEQQALERRAAGPVRDLR